MASPVLGPTTLPSASKETLDLLSKSKQNASLRQFLYRQFFVTPALPQNISLAGKTAIVTGANSGIGFSTAQQLLSLGLSKLIIAVRDESKGQAAVKALSSNRNLEGIVIEVWKLDMLSYDSIIEFVERCKKLERLDIGILNAGIMKQTFDVSPETKHEECIQVNYLSTALLTILLLPVLKSRPGSERPHLVWVQSEVAFWAKFEEKDNTPLLPAFDKKENFNFPDRYSTSKLLGQLFVAELTKRVPAEVAIITMPTPGWCRDTGLGIMPGWHFGQWVVEGVKMVICRRVDVGSRVVVDAAVRGDDVHGGFLQECVMQPISPFVYIDELDGGKVSKVLWEETMAELGFAGVKDILKELSK